MLNNCVASRDQLPSSQRYVHLGQLPLQVVGTSAIAREVSIQQLPARAPPPPEQRLTIAIDVAVINSVQRVLRDCLQQLATQAVLYAPAAVLRLSRQ